MSVSDRYKATILILLAFYVVGSLQVNLVEAYTETIQLYISPFEGSNWVAVYFTFSYLGLPSEILEGDDPALIGLYFSEYSFEEGRGMMASVWIDRTVIPGSNLARLKADQLIDGLESLISMDLNFLEYNTYGDESVYMYDLEEGYEMHSLFDYVCNKAPGRMFANIIELTMNKNTEKYCSLSIYRDYGILTYSIGVSYYYDDLYQGEFGKTYKFDAKELMGYNGIFYSSPTAEQSILQISLGEIIEETEIKILDMKPSKMGMNWRNPPVGEKTYRVYTYEKQINGSNEEDLYVQFKHVKVGAIDWATTMVILLGFVAAIVVVGVIVQKRGKESREEKVQQPDLSKLKRGPREVNL